MEILRVPCALCVLSACFSSCVCVWELSVDACEVVFGGSESGRGLMSQRDGAALRVNAPSPPMQSESTTSSVNGSIRPTLCSSQSQARVRERSDRWKVESKHNSNTLTSAVCKKDMSVSSKKQQQQLTKCVNLTELHGRWTGLALPEASLS